MQGNNDNGVTTIALPKPQHANCSHGHEEISTGAQDTIYLCNFRVSVDGEWLCLKELQDLDIQDGKKSNIEYANGTGGNSNFGTRNSNNRLIERASTTDTLNKCDRDYWVNYYSRDPASIERSNLVNICKLVVKELLEQSLRYGRMLDSDHLPLQHFFIVLEHVLRHGLRPKKGLLGPKKELWDLLQSVEKYCIEAQDVTASVRDLPTVRTHIGRARAWLRIALMQKKLADYLQPLIEHRDDALAEYYEPHALMMSDEVIVIMGILVGLNVIDCNLCVKEEDLDSQQGVIDFSLYLRSSSRNSPDDDNGTIEPSEGSNMTAVLDQKNYIEELNRHLNATVNNLQAKVETLTTTNALMKEDLAIARNSLLALQAENQALRKNIALNNSTNSSNPNSDNNSDKILDISNNSDLTQNLNEERKKVNELEKELKLQISLKAETDMAMKLLEKDIHEKQDTIISLRRQLEDIKQINLEMYKKLQECEEELTQKGEMVSRLQTKASQIGNILANLEKQGKLEQNELNKTPTSSSLASTSSIQNQRPRSQIVSNSQISFNKKSKNECLGPPHKKLHYIDPIPPFNANKIRKIPTPSSEPDSESLSPSNSKIESKKKNNNSLSENSCKTKNIKNDDGADSNKISLKTDIDNEIKRDSQEKSISEVTTAEDNTEK
ncbi:protein RUFY3-like isoform X2 [Condylostylus longicornis]|uniref:protein RUFY3-like isoform X2 n=1 Tax=Condylostylus longicornis TaxID=2530218 RepID=UPI00244DF626|nr:protein RUFY3-like isoform X2 [Condylostylus longicornis]